MPTVTGTTLRQRRIDHSMLGTTFAFAISTFMISGIYASIYCRGLFQDGAYYLYRITEREWFYLYDPARTTVQMMRQAPVVAMLKLGDFSLIRLGQIFSLAMLLTPPLLVTICWFIVPPDRKIWTLFPIIHLSVGFSTMSFEAVGEASIAASYFWILLFLLLFRTREPFSQLTFLILCGPAFQIHEGTCLLMPILLLAVALRTKDAATTRDRLFLTCAGLLIMAILIYELRWMFYPRIPGTSKGAIYGILTFGFLYFQGHFNLPAVTALVAVAALAATLVFHDVFSRRLGRLSNAVAVSFAVFVMLAIAVAWFVDESLSPAAQSLSRYNALFASIVLGLLVTYGVNGNNLNISGARGPILGIVAVLCLAQMAADLAATTRWRFYIRDFQGRLAESSGLVDWKGCTAARYDARDRDWQLMTVGWVHPIMSIIFSRDGDVRSILNYPPETSFRPIDLSDPNKLPNLRGVSYRTYRRSFESSR